jgi:microcystin-dependent protein
MAYTDMSSNWATSKRVTYQDLNKLGANDVYLKPLIAPFGIIGIWSGSQASIPTGWVLCNGSNSTPDLRDKFPVCAKEDDTVAKTNITGSLTQTGGATTVTLSEANMYGHTHSAGTFASDSTGAHTHAAMSCRATISTNQTVFYAADDSSDIATINTSTSGAHTHTLSGATASEGSGTALSILQVYYAYCYVMKTNEADTTTDLSSNWTYGKLITSTDLNKLGVNDKYLKTSVIPVGMAFIWKGSIASIPSGWALCDSAGGTIDLRNKFVIGAGSTYAVAATGGDNLTSVATANLPSHTHAVGSYATASSGGHYHTWDVHSGPTQDVGPACGNQNDFQITTSTQADHTHSFSGASGDGGGSQTALSIINPYYAVAFIQKTTEAGVSYNDLSSAWEYKDLDDYAELNKFGGNDKYLNAYIFASGIIGFWKGTIASIPTGWVFCNGANGTPDFRDKMLIGAGNTYAVGDTGGGATATLALTNMPSHTHGVGSLDDAGGGSHSHTIPVTSTGTFGTVASYSGTSTELSQRSLGSSGAHTHSWTGLSASNGSAEAFSILNPYFALAPIMKS